MQHRKHQCGVSGLDLAAVLEVDEGKRKRSESHKVHEFDLLSKGLSSLSSSRATRPIWEGSSSIILAAK